jgi:hypothetical protein
MDKNHDESDNNPEVESEIDDEQWRFITRSNKVSQNNSFVQGSVSTSTLPLHDIFRMGEITNMCIAYMCCRQNWDPGKS